MPIDWNNQKRVNEEQRKRRKKDGNKSTKKYEKTIDGFLMRLYRNMESRISGVQKLKHHLYQGKKLLPRKQFYQWAKSSKKFNTLYKKWVISNYSRKTTPSVDRKNSYKGYILSNMEWVTHSENSRRGALSLKRKK